MKKQQILRAVWPWCLSVVFVLLFANCSGPESGVSLNSSRDLRRPRNNNKVAFSQNWRPAENNSIPYTHNAAVQKWINIFQGNLKGNFDKWVGRIGHYGPTIEDTLDAEGAPRDLIYLSMIESGFNLEARSKAAAVGAWQFIGSTGRMYGLRNDFFMDDRQDLVRATEAAARHLTDLYKTYGDWYLAFAAYNAGPGKVNSAIKHAGTNDYWKLCRTRYLRQETKDYVPRILAAMSIVKNYRKYGYTEKSFWPPMEYDRVSVPDATDIAVIAKSADTDIDTIRSLNPALVSGITRPNQKVSIFIPKGKAQIFEQRYANVRPEERVSHLFHQSNGTESLGTVAKIYGVPIGKLTKANPGLSASGALTRGQSIKIPSSKSVLIAMAERAAASQTARSSLAYHKVKRGETLARIAHSYHVPVGTLARWNNIGRKNPLRRGQTLKIYRKIRGESTLALAAPASGGRYNFSRSSTAATTSAGKRLSGVAYIIMQDEQAPMEVKPADEEVVTTQAGQPRKWTKQDTEKFVATLDAPEPQDESSPDDDSSDDSNDDNTDASSDNAITLSTLAVNTSDEANEPAVVKTAEVSSFSNNEPNAIHVAKASPAQIHVVKKGENLGRIAGKYHISVAQLRAWNSVRGNNIHAGQKLKVSPAGAKQTQLAKSTTKAQNKNNSYIIHRVKLGETLWSVARRYRVSIDLIKKWNGLRSNQVKPNQKLKIMADIGENSALAATT